MALESRQPSRLAPAVRWAMPPLVSGTALAFAFPPFDQAWLAWIAPAPLFAYLLSRGRRPALASFAAGLLFFAILLAWMRHFAWEGWIGAAVFCSSYWALFGAMGRAAVVRAPAALGPAILAAAWTAVEWLRCQGSFGFAWGVLASSQYASPAVLQLLDLTGAFGLSFLMAFVAASAAAVLTRQPGAILSFRVAAILTVLALLRGVWLLAAAPPPTPPNAHRPMLNAQPSTLNTEYSTLRARPSSLRVAVVQASSTVPSETAAVYNRTSVEDYLRFTEAATKEGARLIVWPETALPRGVEDSAAVKLELARRLARGGWLVGGAFARSGLSGGDANSALAIDAGGAILDRYDKVALVPYGEYVPGRGLFPWIARYGVPSEDLVAGREWRPLDLGPLKVGVSICVESTFGRISRSFTRRGASLLAVITSDGWAGRTAAAVQHAAAAPLRAVENRRSVARAAATGISALIDPYGRTVRQLPLFGRGYLVADLPVRSDLTWYTRLGDWPVWLSLALLLWAFAGCPGFRAAPQGRTARSARP